MAILISGDFHNNACGELEYIKRERIFNLYGRKLYKKIKYHVILGDAGFLWNISPLDFINECENYAILKKRDFPVLCIMGNHEPVYGLIGTLKEEDIGIGNNVIVVKESSPYICYLKRGFVYNIDNCKILVLGGGLSIDKMDRIKNISWWEKEYWSHDEKDRLFKLLKREYNFDYVFSHTAPQQIINKLPGLMDIHDEVAHLNDLIDDKIIFKEWFCGHLHKDYEYFDKKYGRNYNFMYKHTCVIDNDTINLEGIVRNLTPQTNHSV